MFFPPTFASILSLSGGTPPDPYSGHKYFDVDDRTAGGWGITPADSPLIGYVSGGKWYAYQNQTQGITSPYSAWSVGKKICARFSPFNVGGSVSVLANNDSSPTGAASITNTDGNYRFYVGGLLLGTHSFTGSVTICLEISSSINYSVEFKDGDGSVIDSGTGSILPSPSLLSFGVSLHSPASGGNTACEQVDFLT